MRVIVHAGTHKTGTTALQAMLATRDNDGRAEVFFPKTCRGSGTGHQALPLELMDDPLYDPREGTFAELLEEMTARGAPLTILSAEELQMLHGHQAAMRRLESSLRAAGFEASVVIYVRRRDHYASAVYAQLAFARSLRRSFDALMEAVLETGTFAFGHRRFRFEYAELGGRFEPVFTPERVRVRPYVEGVEPLWLLRDFLATAGTDSASFEAAAAAIGRVNVRSSVHRVMSDLYSNAAAAALGAPTPAELAKSLYGDVAASVLAEQFHPIDAAYAARLQARFATDDERIRERFGVKWSVEAADEARASAERGARQLLLVRAAAQAWSLE